MNPYFHRKIATPGITVYLLSLLIISMLFNRFAMEFSFILIGVVGVLLFFFMGSRLTYTWHNISTRQFETNLFVLSLSIRAVCVVFFYHFYTAKTGIPFEFGAADEYVYYDGASRFAKEKLVFLVDYLRGGIMLGGVSDTGYLIALALLYKITNNIIVTHLVKALMSAYATVLVYRIASRNFGEDAGRMAGIFYALMPNIIIYCCNTLKESLMVFLMIAFVERTDFLFRSRRYSLKDFLLPSLIALSLYTFRTVIGAACIFSFSTAAVLVPKKQISAWSKRLLIFAWIVTAVGVFYGGRLTEEMKEYWELRSTNETVKRDFQAKKLGASWAKYATGTVMAPMIVALPFSTMIDVEQQYNQNVRHGGNYIRNYLAFFVILALVLMVFINKDWREHALLLSFTFSYLAVIAFSGYANSERFLFPALPFLLMLAAHGITQITPRSYRYLKYWWVVVFVMEFAWAFFKVGARGLL